MLKNGKKKRIWKDIEPSLKDKDSFMHTIGKLHLVEIFKKQGINVQLIPKGKGASPDLKIQALGKKEEWMYVECYQPNIFSGDSSVIPIRKIRKIVNRSMDKAKKQFSNLYPGILAIIGYNPSNENWGLLKKILTKRLDETNRPYLAGFYLVQIYAFMNKVRGRISFNMKSSYTYIPNPSYFGRIDIEENKNDDKSQDNKEQYVQINTSDLIGKALSEIELPRFQIEQENEINRKLFTIPLEIYLKTDPKKDTIFTLNDDDIPFFQGKSNRNYTCSNCGKILAEKIWEYSMINIIFKCPVCNYFLLMPSKEIPKYPLKGTIGIISGFYDMGRTVLLSQGIVMIGGLDESARAK